ncbi:hypothetical protein K488DRAFT_26492, partial [Vararia minispora EC-137]
FDATPRNKFIARNSFTGPAGSAAGGDVDSIGGLINILSNNAGDGGISQSGGATSGASIPPPPTPGNGAGMSSYSGLGGPADGGSVGAYDGPWGELGLDLVDIGSGNAGQGGGAASGSS